MQKTPQQSAVSSARGQSQSQSCAAGKGREVNRRTSELRTAERRTDMDQARPGLVPGGPGLCLGPSLRQATHVFFQFPLNRSAKTA